MKAIGITAEYNPFHNGHAYQIRRAKEISGADFAVAVMSPDFVQRGEPAFLDKYTRTKMALLGGADLVLELPICYALSSAQNFARGSIGIMHALGCIDLVSFGCESSEKAPLFLAADIMYREPPLYAQALQNALRSGRSFPAAREHALLIYLSRNDASADESLLLDAISSGLLKGSNNILALEYIQAILRLDSHMEFLPVTRIGAAYHAGAEESIAAVYPSAQAIRELCRKGYSDQNFSGSDLHDHLCAMMPEACVQILLHALSQPSSAPGIAAPEEIDSRYHLLLHYALLQACADNSLASYEDISSDLAKRIANCLPQYGDGCGFADLLKTKQITRSHIDRACMHIFLGMKKQPFREPSYVRILGFRKNAGALLHAMQKQSRIPIITKPADAKKQLHPDALLSFESDIHASSMFHLLRKDHVSFPDEYRHSPIICP